MQVVLHAQIAADAGEFTLADVARDIDAKLIRRHPHVFGDVDADSSDEVLKIWDEVKLAERAAKDKAVGGGRGCARGPARRRAHASTGADAGSEGVAQGGCRGL